MLERRASSRAGRDARAARRRGDRRDARTPWIVSAERIRKELDKLLAGESVGARLRSSSRRSWPTSSSRSCRRSGWSRTRCIDTRTCCGTFAVVERAPSPRGCDSPGSCTTSASRRPARSPDGVSFHHHEVVGARMAEQRPGSIPQRDRGRRPETRRAAPSFHGFGDGWTDAAVRRYVRDAGPLLDELNQLTRADCTPRPAPGRTVRASGRARRADRPARRTGEPRGHAPAFGRSPGDGAPRDRSRPLVGEALAYLMEIRMERGEIPEAEAYELLDDWAAERASQPMNRRTFDRQAPSGSRTPADPARSRMKTMQTLRRPGTGSSYPSRSAVRIVSPDPSRFTTKTSRCPLDLAGEREPVPLRRPDGEESS